MLKSAHSPFFLFFCLKSVFKAQKTWRQRPKLQKATPLRKKINFIYKYAARDVAAAGRLFLKLKSGFFLHLCRINLHFA